MPPEDGALFGLPPAPPAEQQQRQRPARPRDGEWVLTVRRPWAWGLIFGDKDVENRSWYTAHRGRLWIHAGTKYEQSALDAWPSRRLPPAREQQPGGVIIGAIELVDVVRGARSPWAIPGQWHWLRGESTPAHRADPGRRCPAAVGRPAGAAGPDPRRSLTPGLRQPPGSETMYA